jgi:glycine cleavage system protein P-like pyridoxal-binding family
MAKCKMLEKYDLDKFVRFIYMGKAMIDYATEGDLENFKRLFAEADVKEICDVVHNNGGQVYMDGANLNA